MTCLLIATITNVRHQILTLKSSTDSVIDTLWFTPVALKKLNNKIN